MIRKVPLRKREVGKIARRVPGWPHRLAASAGSGHAWGCWGSPPPQPNDGVLQVQVDKPLQRGCAVTRIQGWFSPDTGDPKAESALQQQGPYAFPKLTFVSSFTCLILNVVVIQIIAFITILLLSCGQNALWAHLLWVGMEDGFCFGKTLQLPVNPGKQK